MRYANAGVLELWYVATVADPEDPTTAELNAGVDVTPQLTDAGVNVPLDGSLVETGDMDDRFNQTAAGTYGGQPGSAEFHREKAEADDLAYTTLPRGTDGYWAIARRGLATKGTWAVGDRVDLVPMEVISRNPTNNGRNQNPRITVQFGIPGVPNEDYELAT